MRAVCTRKGGRMRYAICTLGLMLAAGASGCSEAPGPATGVPQRAGRGDFSSRHIPGDLTTIEDVSARVFGSHFRVDRDATSSRRLVSRATEIEGRTQPTNVRDRIRL